MKSKHLIAAFVLAIGVGAGSAWAQESTYSVSGLPASESMVSQDQAESMRETVAKVIGAMELYESYLSMGYQPMHASMLTNWDVYTALMAIEPSLENDEKLASEMKRLYDSYLPVK